MLWMASKRSIQIKPLNPNLPLLCTRLMESISTPIKTEMPLTNKIEAKSEEFEDKYHLKSSFSFKKAVVVADLNKTDADPHKIKRENHLEASSEVKSGAAKPNFNKTEVKNLQVLLPLLLVTIGLFIIAYRKNSGYSIPILSLGMLKAFLLERLLPVYRSMPEKEKSNGKLRMKFAIWFISTTLAFLLIFMWSDVLKWSFKSTVAVDVVVLISSIFLLYAWIIGDFVNYRKIWLSGKDEIDVTENPTIVAGK